MKLFRRTAAAGVAPDPEAPAHSGPLGRMVASFRRETELRASVVLPQYARPGRPVLYVLLGLAVAAFCFVYGFGFALMAPTRMVQFAFPILVLGLLTIWALPELGTAPTGILHRLFFAFFLSIPLWPNYLAIALPGLPWITVLRLIGFPLVLALLISLSISRQFRSEVGQSLGGVPLLWKFVTAFAILQVLSVGLSNAPQISIQKLIVTQMSWTAMFFLAALVFRKPGRFELWASLLVVAAVILTGIAIRESQLQKVLWAGHIPSFLAVEDEAVQRILSIGFRAGTAQYRSQATYATALGLGEFLAIVTPFILHFVGGPYRFWLRLIGLALLPLIFFGIFLTDTRLGVVGFIMSVGIYIFFWGALRWRQNPKSMIGPAVVLSYPATALAFIAAVLVVPRLRLMTLGGGQHQASTEARYTQWGEGIPLVLSNPWGFGIARGARALNYTNPGGQMTIDTYWLLTALDYGVLGFVLFYGAYLIAMWAGFWAIVRGVRQRELTLLIPVTISLFVYVVIKSIYAGVENQPLTFMMLGAVAALVYRAKLEKDAEAGGSTATPKKRRRRM